MTKGTIIKTTYGKWYTVVEVWDNIITTTEGPKVHVSNVVEIK